MTFSRSPFTGSTAIHRRGNLNEIYFAHLRLTGQEGCTFRRSNKTFPPTDTTAHSSQVPQVLHAALGQGGADDHITLFGQLV